MKLELAYQEFLMACSADGLKETTLNWYRSLLRAFVDAHPDVSLTDVTTHTLRVYLTGLRAQTTHYSGGQRRELPGGLTAATIGSHTRALHRFWAWIAQEYSLTNPMRSIRYPKKPTPVPKAIDLSDAVKLFAATEYSTGADRDRAILALLLDTGIRAGGLVGLKMDDIDLVEHRAYVTEKGDQSRVVVFTEFTAQLVRRWCAVRLPAPTLFYNLDTLKPLTVSGLRQILKRLGKRAGVDGRINPHSFRHGFAKEYLKAGGDLATLSKLLGHRDVSTTIAHYTIFTDSEVAEKHEKFSPVKRLQK